MSLIKWTPGGLIPKIESMWDNFVSEDFFKKGLDLGTTIPAVNTSETDNSYNINVALPGINKQDIKLDVDDNILTISSETKNQKEEKDGEKITRQEFSYSSFKRVFQLPSNIQEDGISAEYADGILKISVPKAEPAKIENKKQIEIK